MHQAPCILQQAPGTRHQAPSSLLLLYLRLTPSQVAGFVGKLCAMQERVMAREERRVVITPEVVEVEGSV